MFRFDIIFNVTSFVLLFSRTQPLHFETVWLSRNWELYDLWKRYLYVNRKNDNYVIYKCYTNKLSRCSWRVAAWLCICEDFPSCCLQVYLIRGVCHISHFSLFCIYESFDCIKIQTKEQLQFIRLQNILLCTVCVTSHNLAKISYPLLWFCSFCFKYVLWTGFLLVIVCACTMICITITINKVSQDNGNGSQKFLRLLYSDDGERLSSDLISLPAIALRCSRRRGNDHLRGG